MSQLCFYLPPFSSDYAGACSSLFDLGGMVVIHDGACCSRNYVGFDEPRWFGNKRPIFCSGLREVDAVMGADDKLIQKIQTMLQTMEPPAFIAILGSPVPTVIGADLKGIAMELEDLTGIPSFGLDTTGLRYYNRGIDLAASALVERYTQPKPVRRPGRVNLLGLTPLDFSDNENAADLRAFLEEEGWHVQCSFMMGASLEDIAAASEAEVNLVVSQSGMGLARTMWRRWQIPYVAGTLAGTDRRPLSHRIQTACATGVCSPAGAHFPEPGGVLVVGDQVLANSIRERLNTQYGVRGVTVGTFFGLDRELAQPFDLDIPSEAALVELIQSRRYQVLVGDPLLQEIPGSDRLACFSVPHVAVSSKLYWHDYLRFASPEMEQLLEQIAAAARMQG